MSTIQSDKKEWTPQERSDWYRTRAEARAAGRPEPDIRIPVRCAGCNSQGRILGSVFAANDGHWSHECQVQLDLFGSTVNPGTKAFKRRQQIMAWMTEGRHDVVAQIEGRPS
jgi:hypothetical protein